MDKPEIGEEDVLIRVAACAINYVDIWVRRGTTGRNLELPHIPGADVSGTIEEVGGQVDDVREGDEVVVNPGLNCGECEFCAMGQDSMCIHYKILGEHVLGGYAEFVKVPSRNVIQVPDGQDLVRMAAVPLVYMTAWRGLVSRGEVGPGDDILVTGATGGVATAAIQIAKLSGARVLTATTSPEKEDSLLDLGADVVVDASGGEFHSEVRKLTGKRGVDLIFDSVGEAFWDEYVKSLRKGGRLVNYGATSGKDASTDLRYIYWNQLEILGTTMATSTELRDVLDFVWVGKLQPVIDSEFPLSDAAQAHKRIEAKKHFGKVLLRP